MTTDATNAVDLDADGTNQLSDTNSEEKQNANKKESVPGEGYVCKLCGKPGHWIQQCSLKRKKNKKKRKKPSSNNEGDNSKSNNHTYFRNDEDEDEGQQREQEHEQHEYRPGIDPSPKDIERAKEMQKIKPPKCHCDITSRLKKVKKSKVKEGSRANGQYFFFCSKKKDDPTKCNFAKPVNAKEENQKHQSNFFAKKRKGLYNTK